MKMIDEAFKKTIVLNWASPSLNAYERAHWTVRRRWKQRVYLELLSIIGKAREPIKSEVRITVQIFRPKRRFDSDNCAAARKILVDCLKVGPHGLGWLKNDSPEYVESQDLPCELSDHPRVVVTVETV